jgi:predicted nucleic acid-binding protein
VNRLINRIGTVDTDQVIARRAGQLRFAVQRSGSRRTSTGIDAMVAAHAADAHEAVVFTTDPSDLRRLLVDCPWVAVDKP